MLIVRGRNEADTEAAEEKMTSLPSVKDRIKSLQGQGLQIQLQAPNQMMAAASNAVKSRRPNAPSKSVRPTAFPSSSVTTPLSATFTSPTSPQTNSTSPSVYEPSPTISSDRAEPLSPQSTASHALFPSSSTQPTSSQQQFVSLSSLGPPSPASSAPPSPQSSAPDLQKIVNGIETTSPTFNKSYPSLEDWENTLERGMSSLNIHGHERSPAQWDNQSQNHGQNIVIPPSSFTRSPTSPQQFSPQPSPHPSLSRRFSLLSMDRPASTPPRPLPIPDSPTNDIFPLPDTVTKLSPRDIYALQQKRKQILFIDLRPRDRFESERVRGDVICVEPTFSSSSSATAYASQDLTSERITSSLELSPKSERVLFDNRRNFSMVVVYEAEEPTQLGRNVARALWDMEFRKEWKLKKAPVLMSGGFGRWKSEVGDVGTITAMGGSGSGRLKTRDSVVSLKSSASASGSLNGVDGSGVGATTISREVTGQKLSPTSTANGWATPLQTKLSPSPAVSSSGLPFGPSAPIPPTLPTRRLSPPKELQPPPTHPPPPPPSQGYTSSHPSQSYPSFDSAESGSRLENASASRPLPIPTPSAPTLASSSSASGTSMGITREQFWVPPTSTREREQEDVSRKRNGLVRPPSSSYLQNGPSSSFDQVSLSSHTPPTKMRTTYRIC